MTRALCIGTSARVWDEVQQAFALSDYDAFYLCNTAALRWSRGPFTWVSITPHMLPELMGSCSIPRSNYTTLAPPDDDLQVFNHCPVDRRFSSRWAGRPVKCCGLFAVEAALADGAGRVVLAGIPQDGRAGHIRGICTPLVHFALWQDAAPQLLGRVRSISGRTRELLGEPTKEWLHST